MTLIIELTPEQEESLKVVADLRGIEPPELAKLLITDSLPPLPPKVRVSALGKYSYVRGSSEEFMKERREENEREEARWEEQYGARKT